MNIINDPYSSRTAGVGQGITTALQGLLEGVAHGKAKELHQRNISRALQPYGFSQEQAQDFSFLPPEIQKMAFEAQAGGSNADLFGGQQESPAQQLLQQQPQNKFAQAREDGPQSQLSQALAYLKQQNPNLELTPQAGGENFLQNLQRQAPQQQSFMRALENPKETNLLDSLLKNAPQETPEQNTAVARQPNLGTAPIAPTRPTVDQLLNAANKTIGKRREHFLKLAQIESNREEKIKAHREKETDISRREQHRVDKETEPYYKKLTTEAKGAKEANRRLGRMEELVDKGNLPHPLLNSFIKTIGHGVWGIGFDLDVLAGADAAEFKQLSNEFIEGAKAIFGNRITDNDLKAFMATIPDLSQSDAGKKRIIHNMRQANEAKFIKKQAADQIIRENGGKRPADIEMLVDKRTEKQLDDLAERFIQGYKPTKENKGTFAHNDYLS